MSLKLGFIFLLLISANVASLSLYQFFRPGSLALAAQAIDQQGKLRHLAEAIAHEAVHPSVSKDFVEENIVRYEQGLRSLEEQPVDWHLGLIMEPDSEIGKSLAALREQWEQYRSAAETLTGLEVENARRMQAEAYVDTHTASLVRAADRAVKARVAGAERYGSFLDIVFYSLTTGQFLLLLLVFLYMRRGVTRPILAMAQMIRRFAAGDHAARVAFSSNDEIGYLAISLNRTVEELARLLDEQAQMTAMFESSHEAITITDTTPRIIRVNPAFTRITGYAPEDVVGQNPRVLQSGRYPLAFYRHMWRQIEDAGHWQGEIWNRRRSGEVYPQWLSISAVRGRMGLVTHYVGIFSDISEFKRTEAMLRNHANELQRTNAELEEFAYAASHDLKAPLRAVANLAYCLEEDAGDSLDAENRDRLQLLRSRVMQMDGLINGLLGYARLGRETESVEAVALAPLLARIRGSLDVPPGFRIEIHEPLPSFTALPVHLEQIFRNLLVNALQHHDRDAARIDIRARSDRKWWYVDIMDDGPGIPVSARESVFKIFNTLATGSEASSGIGLALVRKLVRRYGGEVELLENIPRGSVFRIRWPVAG
ncbi:sensor histidine kinase [Thiohalomonas denitrificans]|uniref:sensor histidine kinase n=1 Tax=Thiohalomonas denitrificans TaxID=415747 RepID=UPI001585F6E5|nr:ATP-binding protein [Thiohalomonas denitrificans]